MDDGTNDGINVFKENRNLVTFSGKPLIQRTEDLTSINLESENYAIFDCKSAVCVRTSGFIKYGEDFSRIGSCPNYDNSYCINQSKKYIFFGNAGKLNFSGTGFIYTIEHRAFEYDTPKDITSGNDYFFDYGSSQYDYINFSNANIVAFAKNEVNEDFDDIYITYITTSTNVVGKEAEKCNSDIHYHYGIYSDFETKDSYPCENTETTLKIVII